MIDPPKGFDRAQAEYERREPPEDKETEDGDPRCEPEYWMDR